MPDSEGSQLLPKDLGSGEPVSKGFGPKKGSLSKQVNQGIHSPDWEGEKGKQKYRSGDRG